MPLWHLRPDGWSAHREAGHWDRGLQVYRDGLLPAHHRLSCLLYTSRPGIAPT